MNESNVCATMKNKDKIKRALKSQLNFSQDVEKWRTQFYEEKNSCMDQRPESEANNPDLRQQSPDFNLSSSRKQENILVRTF